MVQKVSHCQIINKMYKIVLKPTSEFRFIIQSEHQTCTLILSVGIRYSMHDLMCKVSCMNYKAITGVKYA